MQCKKKECIGKKDAHIKSEKNSNIKKMWNGRRSVKQQQQQQTYHPNKLYIDQCYVL